MVKYWSAGPERTLLVVDSRICVLGVVCLRVSVCVCLCVCVWTRGMNLIPLIVIDSHLRNTATCQHHVHCETTSSHRGGSAAGIPVIEFVLGLRGFSWHRAHGQESVRLTHSQLLRNRVWRQPCTHLTTEWGWVSGWPCGEMWTVSAKHQVFWGQTGWNTDRETNQTRATKQFFLGSFWPILAAYKLLIIQRKLMAWSEKQNPGKTCSNIKPLVWWRPLRMLQTFYLIFRISCPVLK